MRDRHCCVNVFIFNMTTSFGEIAEWPVANQSASLLPVHVLILIRDMTSQKYMNGADTGSIRLEGQKKKLAVFL